MKNIGFIGLGVMGLPMAVNLAKNGHEVLGYDIDPHRSALLAEQGGKATQKPEDIYRSSDILFLCLPTNELVNRTVASILDSCQRGAVIVDLSSSSPTIIRELYGKACDKGVSLLDAPVSGGETGAAAGTLVIMCGGDKEVFDKVKPLLMCMGSSATYMGGSGCGSVAKLANNMIVACNLASVGEGFAFAVKAGLDPKVLYDAIKGGFAGSAVLDLKVPKIISRDFSASARTAVHQKDLKNALNLAEELGVEIPLSKMVLDYMNQLEEMGKVDEDHCAVARIYERDMGVEIQ